VAETYVRVNKIESNNKENAISLPFICSRENTYSTVRLSLFSHCPVRIAKPLQIAPTTKKSPNIYVNVLHLPLILKHQIAGPLTAKDKESQTKNAFFSSS
jgi:hypothetical protein